MFFFVLIYVIMTIFCCTHFWRKRTLTVTYFTVSCIRSFPQFSSSNCNGSSVVNPKTDAINLCLLLFSALQIEQQSSHMLNFHNQFSKHVCFSHSCAQSHNWLPSRIICNNPTIHQNHITWHGTECILASCKITVWQRVQHIQLLIPCVK
jgi:hypothetical protein